MKPVIIIYDKKDPVSLKAKHKAKEANPRATVLEVSNKKAISKALKGTGNVVHNFAEKLDKRQVKGDDVKTDKKEAPKKEAPKKEAPKKEKKAKK